MWLNVNQLNNRHYQQGVFKADGTFYYSLVYESIYMLYSTTKVNKYNKYMRVNSNVCHRTVTCSMSEGFCPYIDFKLSINTLSTNPMHMCASLPVFIHFN